MTNDARKYAERYRISLSFSKPSADDLKLGIKSKVKMSFQFENNQTQLTANWYRRTMDMSKYFDDICDKTCEYLNNHFEHLAPNVQCSRASTLDVKATECFGAKDLFCDIPLSSFDLLAMDGDFNSFLEEHKIIKG